MNPQRRTSTRTIVRKFINSLPSKYVELLTIIRPANLDEIIEVALDMEASQKVKARKRNQAYIVDIIEKFYQKVYNL